MCKAPEMEDFPSRRGGTLADTDPLLWTLRTAKCSGGIESFWRKNCPLTAARLMLYSTNSAAVSRSIRPRRGGRAAECGGLLIFPDLFAQTDFREFCLRYGLLSCSETLPFAV